MGNFAENIAVPFNVSDFKKRFLCEFVVGKERQQKGRYIL